MKIGIPKEIYPGERRVATTPEVAARLLALGFSVTLETGAGAAADFGDDAYKQAGVEVVPTASDLWTNSDIVFKVRAPESNEVALLREGATLISFIWPAQNSELMNQLALRKVTVLAMDCVPRVSRAQKLDALSSMANIAGYRAVIEAAHHFGRFFTGQVTAAGKVPPAKVFVVGAGVAGLAAIGVAVGLGAIVRANDTRPEVADQIRSMGAEFVPVLFVEEGTGAGGYAKSMSEGFQKAQRDVYARQAMDVDIIITTAQIPGKTAPKLITAGMVESMKPGSVIVDLAAEQGGNCELTEPGRVVVRQGVTIIGFTDMPSRLAKQASSLYATNLFRFAEELCPKKDGDLFVDMDDLVIRGSTVIKDGLISWPPPAPKIAAPVAVPLRAEQAATIAEIATKKSRTSQGVGPSIVFIMGIVFFMLVGNFAPASFIPHFTVFVLACFVGYMVVWNVSPALHTPLMSVTNAISSIIAIGALTQISNLGRWTQGLALIAVSLTAINMFGGFAVTQRMLAMFRK